MNLALRIKVVFFFSSRSRHTTLTCDWSSDVCSSDLMPEARGLWAAAASWIKEGPGCGRAVAELMSGRVPTVDVHEADAARFYPYQRTVAHVRARAREGFNKMYGIVHPAEQWESS